MTLRQSQVSLSATLRTSLLNIQQFANICRTTPRTLRFYEQKGLFKPKKVINHNRYRLYDPTQARQFLQIKLLQNFHEPLSKIKPLLIKNKAYDYLESEIKKITAEVHEKQKELLFLQRIKSLFYPKTGFNVLKTDTFGPSILFCRYIKKGSYHKINQYITELWEMAHRYHLNCKENEITFYIDPEYKPNGSPLEIALIHEGNTIPTLEQPFPSDIYLKRYQKTKCLSYEYNGPYDYLTLIYQKLYEIIQKQNILITGNVFEQYIDGPLNNHSSYNYKTILRFPIQ